MTTFSPYEYALVRGWDFGCIEATAERGLADADVEAIDQWAGVHDDNYDPPTDEAAADEAAAVRVAQVAREHLLAWCKARVAEAERDQTEVAE